MVFHKMAGGYERKLEIKYSVVLEICKAKHILFAETSELISKRDKIHKWQEIFEHSVSIGGINATHNWSYLRDVYWPNIKRSTMTKVYRQGVLSRIDLSVLEILNLKGAAGKHGQKIKREILKLEQTLHERQAASVEQSLCDAVSIDDNILPIKEESISFPNSPEDVYNDEDNDENNHLNHFHDENLLQQHLEEAPTMEPDPPNQCDTPLVTQEEGFKKINLTLNNPTRRISSTVTTPNILDEISTLRKRKLEEEVEYLRLQNVKAKLEIREAEIRVLMLEKDLELKTFQVAEQVK